LRVRVDASEAALARVPLTGMVVYVSRDETRFIDMVKCLQQRVTYDMRAGWDFQKTGGSTSRVDDSD
jgi:hypothetical protein